MFDCTFKDVIIDTQRENTTFLFTGCQLYDKYMRGIIFGITTNWTYF